MTDAGTAEAMSLDEKVDAQVFGGGVYHFHGEGEPNHEPLEVRDGDIELMLQGMIVRLPEEPVYVNDEPYVFDIDDTRLVHAVNCARTKNVVSPGRWEPRMLEVSLVDSLPSQIEDAYPIAEDGDGDRSYPFDRETTTLNVVMPAEVKQSSAGTEDLVGKVEAAANQQLAIGLEQIDQMKDRKFIQKLQIAGWMAIYGTAGEALALMGPNAMNTGVPGRVAVGAYIGLVASMAGLVGKSLYMQRKFGESRPIDTIVRKSYEAAVKRNPSFEEPIISLVRAQEEPEPQAA